MANSKYDVIVIGGGPGGYVTAIRSAQLGLKTCVIEREHLGGICLNWGCIPTKALLRSSEILDLIKHSEDYGIKVKGYEFDFDAVIKRSRQVSAKLNQGVGFLLKKNKVDVVMANATLLSNNQVQADKEILTANHIILATGARARELPDFKADGQQIWTYKDALAPKKLPKSMLVIGSGAIGMEFANFYHAMGVDVTVAEIMPQILPAEDAEIAEFARKSFVKHGINIITNAKISDVKKSTSNVTAKINDGKKTHDINVDVVLSAVGIVGNIEHLGLEKLGVKTEKSHIICDEWGRTNVNGIYAIGDVAGAPWLAHKAEHEGVACIEKIANHAGAHPFKTDNIPGCTYTHPQIASIGLREEDAKQQGYKVKIGRFPYQGNGKALAMGYSEGMIKVIFDQKTGALLGAHMVGADVTELIQGYVIARQLETTEAELGHTIFPHPTLSEMMHEAVLDAYGRAIHI